MKVRRRKTKKAKLTKGKVYRKPGYYWIKVGNGQNSRWIIGRWWQSLQWFDTMSTIREIGWRDKILEVDENRIINPHI